MRKPGTQVPAGRNARFPSGAARGQELPQARVFSGQNRAPATELAARAGLMTLKVSRTALPRWRDQLLEGSINTAAANHADRPGQGGAGKPVSAMPKPPKSASPHSVAPQPPSEPPAFDQLLAAFRLIDAAGVWLEKLGAELDDVLRQIGRGSAFTFLAEAGTTSVDHYLSGDTWVLDGWPSRSRSGLRESSSRWVQKDSGHSRAASRPVLRG